MQNKVATTTHPNWHMGTPWGAASSSGARRVQANTLSTSTPKPVKEKEALKRLEEFLEQAENG